MYYVYVLKSLSSGRFYKGFCHNLDNRLSEHNSGKTQSTRPFIPWIIAYYEEFEIIEDAIKRERYFKSSAGRRFLKKVL
jgi:putative endonuclease